MQRQQKPILPCFTLIHNGESPDTPLQFPILSILIQQMVVALAEKRPFAPNKEK